MMKNLVSKIIVHCDAGVSHSAGVAAAIGKYLNNDDSFIFNAPRFLPNRTCCRCVLEAFMGQESVENLSKKIFCSWANKKC